MRATKVCFIKGENKELKEGLPPHFAGKMWIFGRLMCKFSNCQIIQNIRDPLSCKMVLQLFMCPGAKEQENN